MRGAHVYAAGVVATSAELYKGESCSVLVVDASVPEGYQCVCNDGLLGCTKMLCEPICDLEPETGLGRAAFPRFFHNATSGECEEFIWGGAEMGSNANRFEFRATCELVCDPLSARECELTGGETVPSGWAGPDTGLNYCNSCSCSGGLLACTLLVCPN